MSFPPPFDLTGRVALVTGGSKGLGKAMARGLAEAGADVVISSRHEDELQAGPRRDPRRHRPQAAHYVVADMTKRDDVQPAGRRRPLRADGPGGHPRQQRRHQHAAADRRDHRRGLGPTCMETQPHVGHGPDAGPGAADEGAALGPGHPHLVDHGRSCRRRAATPTRRPRRPWSAWPGPAPWTWGRSASRSTASPRGRS